MNYLAKNIENSLLLPSDVMKLIYEYANPFIYIKKTIENKEYDLDEIMYKRMKSYILKYYRNNPNSIYYMIGNYDDIIFLNKHNINDKEYKYAILNYIGGYKSMFFFKFK